jgi:hypothetical protein
MQSHEGSSSETTGENFLYCYQGATLVSDSSVMFTSDRVCLRCTMRVSYAFTQPLAITKITKA